MMADFKPTKSQKNAIETRDRAVLVSAAAGSGKTKVLTERLLGRISEDADIDSFLVITYTKAAAAELKSRIMDEISARLAVEPDNKRLRRQNALCQRAQIGTIHSFCANLLRENCHAAALSPEFKVIEKDRADSIKARVIEKLMEQRYEAPDDGFRQLADSVGRGRDDKQLVNAVLKLHEKMQSHARPEKWAAEQIEMLDVKADDAGDTLWGREILNSLKSSAECWAEQMDMLAMRAAEDEKLYKAYGQSLSDSALSLRDFMRALDEGWDRAREFLPIEYPKFGSLSKTYISEARDNITTVRDACKNVAKGYIKTLNMRSEKVLSDLRETAPAMKAMLELVLDFDKAYAAEKRRRAEVDFSDLEHFAAKILTDENGEATELAKEISGRFTEIMVDEYQDVNSVQDTIFRALSKDGSNLFMVGDVKQSIYRFRLADPTIFTEKYNSYADIENAQGNEPVRIMLQENFRSRREIIDAANHIFNFCMSEKLGEVEYDDNACLKCGAQYDGTVPSPEMYVISVPKGGEEESPDKSALEASFAAKKIKELVSSGMTVADKDFARPVRYGDIAIIMPSANAVGEVYRTELAKLNIPVAAGQGVTFFKSQEIRFMLCLLAVVDNPHQDVPLIAVLRSPTFGFNADELTAIRACDKNCDFYNAMTKRAAENEKCSAAIEKINRFRENAPDMELGELIWYIYDELDLMAIASAMPDGGAVRYNLGELPEYAKRFESTGFRGLHKFVEWLENLGENGDDRSGGGGGDAVQIMTIHKSKGLEFPVVFLCDMGRQFNTQDLKEKVLIHPELGLGPKFTDTERGIEYSTVARDAISLRTDRELLSEKMRLLYVAVTRAKERLFITGAVKGDTEKWAQKLMNMYSEPMSPEILSSSQNFLTWLMYACFADKQGKLKYSIIYPESEDTSEEENKQENKVLAPPEIVAELEEKLSFRYAYNEAVALPSKVTATELKNFDSPDEEAENIAPKKQPSFRKPDLRRSEKAMTGAEKGTATHMVLQFIDYAKAKDAESIESEIARLEAEKFITSRQAEAVSVNAIEKLFNSPLGERINNADSVKREFKFSLLCPAEDFFAAAVGEKVLLQGVIDCCIEENGELTIIDYKTDRVKGVAIKERAEVYAGQVRAYAIAAKRITGKPVKECVLYFLDAGEEVTVKP